MEAKDIKVGMRFKNRANNRIAYVARIDDTGIGADMVYEEVAEGQSKGGRASLTNLAGQKSWGYLHDDVTPEPKVKAEDAAGDGTPLTEVMQEIVADAEKRSKEAKEKKSKKAEKPVKKEKPVKQEKTVKEKPKKEVKEKPAKAAAEPDENAIVSKFKVNMNKEGIAEYLADAVESVKGMSAIMSDDGCGLSVVRDRGIIARITVRSSRITIDCANKEMVEAIIKSI